MHLALAEDALALIIIIGVLSEIRGVTFDRPRAGKSASLSRPVILSAAPMKTLKKDEFNTVN